MNDDYYDGRRDFERGYSRPDQLSPNRRQGFNDAEMDKWRNEQIKIHEEMEQERRERSLQTSREAAQLGSELGTALGAAIVTGTGEALRYTVDAYREGFFRGTVNFILPIVFFCYLSSIWITGLFGIWGATTVVPAMFRDMQSLDYAAVKATFLSASSATRWFIVLAGGSPLWLCLLILIGRMLYRLADLLSGVTSSIFRRS